MVWTILLRCLISACEKPLGNAFSLDECKRYILARMKRYTTVQAKQQFSRLLDAAEQGEAVIIERRGVRFRVRTERQAAPKNTSRLPMIEIVDPAVVAGNWTWDWKADRLQFASVKRGRR